MSFELTKFYKMTEADIMRSRQGIGRCSQSGVQVLLTRSSQQITLVLYYIGLDISLGLKYVDNTYPGAQSIETGPASGYLEYQCKVFEVGSLQNGELYNQEPQLEFHYGSRAQKPYMVWLLGPDSILLLQPDPLGTLHTQKVHVLVVSTGRHSPREGFGRPTSPHP